jgi:hypothetical protein
MPAAEPDLIGEIGLPDSFGLTEGFYSTCDFLNQGVFVHGGDTSLSELIEFATSSDAV